MPIYCLLKQFAIWFLNMTIQHIWILNTTVMICFYSLCLTQILLPLWCNLLYQLMPTYCLLIKQFAIWFLIMTMLIYEFPIQQCWYICVLYVILIKFRIANDEIVMTVPSKWSVDRTNWWTVVISCRPVLPGGCGLHEHARLHDTLQKLGIISMILGA